jgi:hypothetical protein
MIIILHSDHIMWFPMYLSVVFLKIINTITVQSCGD